jgi:threonyl-tRNA synthetase
MPKRTPQLETLRHSTAHLMAAAVKRLYPKTKLGIGPTTELGFYYDFDPPKGADLSPHAFAAIEAEMRAMIDAKLPFRKVFLTIPQAMRFFQKRGESYKLELLRELGKRVKRVSVYWTGDTFVDLCTGPHVRSTGDIPKDAFRLTKAASAYWRGDERNPQLRRIYGTVFFTKGELDRELERLTEIERRDHRKLGASLDLFSFHEIAPGAPFWHPKGMRIVRELEAYWRRVHDAAGYTEISTPIMVKKELFEKSGHWRYYRENMFVVEEGDGTYVLKPMNCPESTYIYRASIRSFRDLPMRLSEIGRLHRNERSGTLGGLLRVRQLTMDDAHIYCTPEQIEDEIERILALIERFYTLFGFTPRFFLATKPEKAMGSPTLWAKAQRGLRNALKRKGLPFTLKPKDGAFYGPKIDIHISDALGRDWQLATIQLDLVMLPERFDLSYIDRNGRKKRPVVIHRAIFGSFERFIGVLLEHTGGNLPLWLSPIHVRVLPIAARHEEKAKMIVETLMHANIRTDTVAAEETLGKRIREAELEKIPYVAVVGDREAMGEVTIRERGNEMQRKVRIETLIEEIHRSFPR